MISSTADAPARESADAVTYRQRAQNMTVHGMKKQNVTEYLPSILRRSRETMLRSVVHNLMLGPV